MTKQEIYDTVLIHLRKQGKAAVDLDGNCQYRGPDGTSCAVGSLIPDELYDPKIESLGVNYIFNTALVYQPIRQADALGHICNRIAKNLGVEHKPLYNHLQHAHDSYLADDGLLAWEASMVRIALDFNLHYTPPENSNENYE